MNVTELTAEARHTLQAAHTRLKAGTYTDLIEARALTVDAAEQLHQAYLAVDETPPAALDALSDRMAATRTAILTATWTPAVRQQALRTLGNGTDATDTLWLVDAFPIGPAGDTLVTALAAADPTDDRHRPRNLDSLLLRLPAWAIDRILDQRHIRLLHPWDSGTTITVTSPEHGETTLALLDRTSRTGPLTTLEGASAAAAAILTGR